MRSNETKYETFLCPDCGCLVEVNKDSKKFECDECGLTGKFLEEEPEELENDSTNTTG